MLTVNEYAAAMGVGRRTVYNWIQAGKLHPERLPSGRLRFDAPTPAALAAPPVEFTHARVGSPARLCPPCWKAKNTYDHRQTPVDRVYWCKRCEKRWRLKRSA